MGWIAASLLVGAGACCSDRAVPLRPFNISLWERAELFDARRHAIAGVNLDLPYGRERGVIGLDLGIVNVTTGHGDPPCFDDPDLADPSCADVDEDILDPVRRKRLPSRRALTAGVQLGIVNDDRRGMYGVASGIYSRALGTMAGVSASVVNVHPESTAGISVAIVNAAYAPFGVEGLGHENPRASLGGIEVSLFAWETDVGGLQVGAYNQVARRFGGLQLSCFANLVIGPMDGVQLGGVLDTAGAVRGVQVGGFNLAETTEGVQIGVVNVARTLRGVQLGLVNIAANGLVLVLPVVNVGFR